MCYNSALLNYDITANSTLMNYELTVFDELVYKSLSPFYSEENNREIQTNFLTKHFSNCNRFTIGQYKKEKRRLHFVDKTVLYCIHPAAKSYVTDQLPLFRETEILQINPQIFKELQLDPTSIKKVMDHNQLKKLSVGFMEDCKWNQLSDDNLRYYYYCGVLLQEKEKIIVNIKNKIHLMNSKKEIEQYIHKHQQSLIALCVKLLNQSDFEKKYTGCEIKESYTNQDIQNLIYYYIEKILRFIESNYLGYIDKKKTIPFKSKLIEEYELISKSEFVKSILLDAELNSEIRSIVLTPIFKLNQFNLKDRISYQELIYFNAYISQFYNELKVDPNITEERIMYCMYHVNFNSLELLEYNCRRIKVAMNELGDKELQLDYLNKLLKETNQQSLCSHVSFDLSEPNLKILLSTWIKEEIHYINKSIIKSNQEHSLFPNRIQKELGKIQSDMTVSELALLFRILYDTDALPHDNQSELLQFIADSFYTRRTESISAASLRSKYYSPDNGTIVSLKLQMHKMMAMIDTY